LNKKLLKDQYKEIYKNSPELQEQYKDYTEIPDFEEEIDRITAEFQDKLDELTSWEQAIDAQITTKSAEFEEQKAYTESFKGMLSTNISEDFKFGLNG
jgi:chromosome segregation ATPase